MWTLAKEKVKGGKKMVFGKKNKQEQETNPSLTIQPPFPQDEGQQFQQPIEIQQNPLQIPQVQPVQQIPQPPQQIQQPIVQSNAEIIQIVTTEEGTYRYVIDSKLPLRIGACNLTQ